MPILGIAIASYILYRYPSKQQLKDTHDDMATCCIFTGLSSFTILMVVLLLPFIMATSEILTTVFSIFDYLKVKLIKSN